MKPSNAGLLLTVLIILFGWLALAQIRGVEPKPGDAPADQFSTERAWEHLEEIAREPHPTGSVANERVRDYLVAQLEALGLQPDVQSTTAIFEMRGGAIVGGRVDNVAARFLGKNRGKAVLLMAHYDSVKTGPGAADDGAGVAALLETLRALKAGETLDNDVIVLFTDGEEAGLIGARAFFEQHDWAKDVGMVLNFEARGHRGPSLMFQTSEGNGPLIRAFRKISVPKLSYSYGYEVYKRMPNDTDFTISRDAGIPGLNFAFIHGLNRYHSYLDNLEYLARDSVQHHGEFALELTRLFGNTDLDTEWQKGQNAIYFTLFGPIFISYPGSFALPLAILLLIGAILCLRRGIVFGRITFGRTLGAMFIQLVIGILLGGALMALAGQLVSPFYSYSLANGWSSTSLTLLAIAFLWLAAAVAGFSGIHRRFGDHLLSGGLLLWTLLTLFITLVAPGASFLFAVPLLGGLITAFCWFGRPPEETQVSLAHLAIFALAGIVTCLVWTPTFAFIGVALGSPTALLIGLFGTAVLWGLFVPHLDLLGSGRRVLALLALVAAVGLGGWVQTASEHDPVNRRPNSVFYVYDAEAGQAHWFTTDRAVDDWTRQFLGEAPELQELPGFMGARRTVEWLSASAPIAEGLQSASVEPLGETVDASGTRTIEFHVSWPFHAEIGWINLSTDGDLLAVSFDGQRHVQATSQESAEARSEMRILLVGASRGVTMSVEVAGEEPLDVETVGRDYELPKIAGFSYDPRPEDTMPQWGGLTDTASVRGLVTLVPGAIMPADEGAEDEVEEPALAEAAGG